ncbi:MAG: methyltransferase domain-containing protein [Acidimicrobiales bacterium]
MPESRKPIQQPPDRTETLADYFDRLFGPVLSDPWAARLVEAADLVAGQHVLDVACGSGAVAIAASERVGPAGTVTGLDRNPDMLAVARRKRPELEWRNGSAEELPFDDGMFDVTLCQFGLMFFEDPSRAVAEMLRVLRPGGRTAVAVWDGLERSPGYSALVEVLELHLGAEVAAPVRDSFALGDPALVESLLGTAGFTAVTVGSQEARARFPSLRHWVDAELKGWVGADLDQRTYTELMADASRTLAPFIQADGHTDFALPAVIGVGTKG